MEDEKVVVIDQQAYWVALQKRAHNAVVQVFAQVVSFNWLEPYTTQAQYENRGTGFFIDADGFFVTNAHVVNEAKRIWINVPALGRQLLHAHMVGFCPDSDLALLRIDQSAKKLIDDVLGGIDLFPLGDSDALASTENVLSLGYPLGQYRLKGATGIVSGFESVDGSTLIQITAPVNPGNSGGPLLNVQGEVIGIATASIEPSQNIGYAIPINEFKMLAADLRTQKFLRRPILGVQFTYSGDEKALFLGNPVPSGLYINGVLKNSLFERAGVQEGDMLYAFNGHAIDGYGEARVPWSLDTTTINDLINRTPLGSAVSMVLYRAGKKIETTFEFVLTQPLAIRTVYPEYEDVEYEVIGGMVIMQLTENHIPLLAEDAPDLYAVSENKVEPVLVVTHVFTGSYAHQVRIFLPGDIIVQVNGQAVGTFESFKRALHSSARTGFVTLKTKRNLFGVFSLQRLLAEEARLSKDFAYPISKTVQQLFEAASGGKK